MEEQISGVSNAGARRFLRAISIVSKRYHDVEVNRGKLEMNISKLKRAYSNKKLSKKGIKEEMNRLRENIAAVIDSERRLLGLEGAEISAEKGLSHNMEILKKKLMETEKERDRHMVDNRKRVDEISLSLLTLGRKIDELVEAKQLRNKRVEELEKKAAAKAKNKKSSS